MRTAYLRLWSDGFYGGTFGDMRDLKTKQSITISPRPVAWETVFGRDLYYKASIRPLFKNVELDEYLIVKAQTMRELIDKLNDSYAIEVVFVDPTDELTEMLRRQEKEDLGRFDGALQPKTEELIGWRRKILEKNATRSLYPRTEQGGLVITLSSSEFKEWQRQNRPRKLRCQIR